MNFFKNLKITHYLKKALRLLENKQYLEAELVFEKLIKLNPNSIDTLCGIACCKYELNDIDQALQYINLSLELSPENSVLIFNKILFLRKDQQIDEALELSKSLLEKEESVPDHLKIYYELNFKIKNYQEALKIAKKLLDISEDKVEALFYVADCYSRLEQPKKTIAVYEKILIYEPENYIAFNNLGYNRIKTKEFQQAIIDLDKAIEINEFAFVYNNRGFANLKLGNYELGLEDINLSLEIDNQNSYAFKNRAIYYMMTGDNQAALKDLLIAKELGYQELYGNEVDNLIIEIQAS